MQQRAAPRRRPRRRTARSPAASARSPTRRSRRARRARARARYQPITSSTAAAVMTSVPSGLDAEPGSAGCARGRGRRSATARRRGRARTARTAPRRPRPCRGPGADGRRARARARTGAGSTRSRRWPPRALAWRTIFRSRSQPTANMNSTSPSWPISCSTASASAGNRSLDGSPGQQRRATSGRARCRPRSRRSPTAAPGARTARRPARAAMRITATSSRILPVVALTVIRSRRQSAGRGGSGAGPASSWSTRSARRNVASAWSRLSPTAVRPTLPSSASAPIMWKTTPVWRAWSKCNLCRTAMSNRSSIVRPRRSSSSRWSVATRCFSRPLGAVNSAVPGSYVPSVRNWSVRNGWVVPPLRRLSSIAYGVHASWRSRTTTKSIGEAARAPPRAPAALRSWRPPA